MNCPNCGNNLTQNQQFCGNCGNKILLSNSESNINSIKPKRKKSNNKIIFFCLIFICLCVLGFLGSKMFFSKENKNTSKASTSTAFFISNDDGFEALFDANGKQLTDFKFKGYPTIKNGTARVQNKEGKYGIVSSSGKMIVDFGKYESIYQEGSLYKVYDSEYNSYLLNSSGKNLYSLDNSTLHDFISDSDYYYYILETDIEYKVLNYNGETITKFNKVEYLDDPKVGNLDPYMSVFYNNKNYIIDLETEKVILTFEENKHFCVNDISENNEIILNSCVSSFEKKESNDFKYIDNKKIVFEKNNSNCSNIQFDDGNNILCYLEDGKDAILDKKNGNEKLIFDRYRYNMELSYYDVNNYIINNEETNDIEFYKNDKLVKTVNGNIKNDSYAYNQIYLIEYHKALLGNDEYRFYNSDGNLLNDEVYKDANPFDKYGRAIVKKDDTKYLINTKGEKISNEYSSIITTYYDFYIATDDNGTEILIDSDGKEILSGKSLHLEKKDNTFYCTMDTDDNGYILYNVNTKKELLKYKTYITFSNAYILVYENSKNKYYTYSGKLIYESE